MRNLNLIISCVEHLEFARAEIDAVHSLHSNTSFSTLNCDTCLDSYGNHDALHDMHTSSVSTNFCTSCIDLKYEIETLNKVRDDMSIKLVEHNDMSAHECVSCLVVMEVLVKMKYVHAQVVSQLEITIEELDELRARPVLFNACKNCP